MRSSETAIKRDPIKPQRSPIKPQPPLSRDRLKAVSLIVITCTGIIVCVILAVPFLPALSWALALGVAAYPVHDWISGHIRGPNLAASLSTAVITAGLLVPSVLVVREMGRQTVEGLDRARAALESGNLKGQLKGDPRTARLIRWFEANVDVRKEIERAGDLVQQHAGRWIQGTVWAGLQLLLTIFLLFYFLRDRDLALLSLRSLLPLSDHETDEVLRNVRAMIRATVHGTLAVAAIQGALGGLMFAILQLPAPLLWGLVMGLLAVVPVLGAFVIWLPVAVMLAFEGSWGKALLLAAWGTFVVGLIDNLLYPILVGKDMRLHTVPVFIAILGGLFMFGAFGIILGPIALSLTLALLEVLRRRTAHHGSAEEPA